MSDSLGAIQAGQGGVEVSGTVRVAEQSFTSPLTEQECVVYRFEKEGQLTTHNPDTGGGSRDTWQTIHVEESGAPFYVEDSGERILVDGSTANLDMERSYIVEPSDFQQAVGEKVLTTVTGRETGEPAERGEVADEYVEEIESAKNPRRYKEWLIPVGGAVTVRGDAVAPEQTPIGSNLDAGVHGPTEPANSGLVGTLKGAIGLADEIPADPRARYKPRAIERLPAAEPTIASDDQQVQEVQKTVSLFEGAPQGKLADTPAIAQNMMSKIKDMTDDELRIAEDAMPEAPALEQAQVVISWGAHSEFVVSDSV